MSTSGRTYCFLPAFVMLAAMAGYAFADSYLKLMLLASVQGVCFGLATTAGITVAIDITTSTRRSAGNMIYAWSARLGMLAGACAGFLLYDLYGFRTVVYAAVAVGVLGMYFASRVYVAFRAPIGMRLWHGPLPAAACMGSCTEYAADSFRAGRIVATACIGDYIAFLTLAALVFLTMPFTRCS